MKTNFFKNVTLFSSLLLSQNFTYATGDFGAGNGGGPTPLVERQYPDQGKLKEAANYLIKKVRDSKVHSYLKEDTEKSLNQLLEDEKIVYIDENITSILGISNLGYDTMVSLDAATKCEKGSKIFLSKRTENYSKERLALVLAQEIFHQVVQSIDSCNNDFINVFSQQVINSNIDKDMIAKIEEEYTSYINRNVYDNSYDARISTADYWNKLFPQADCTKMDNCANYLNPKAVQLALRKTKSISPDLLKSSHMLIVDFSKAKGQDRGFLIALPSGQLIASAEMAHSNKSGQLIPRKFGNNEYAHNRRGLYKIKGLHWTRERAGWYNETRVLALYGLENSNNSAKSLGIVIHPSRTNENSRGAFPTTKNFYDLLKSREVQSGTAMYVYGEELQETK